MQIKLFSFNPLCESCYVVWDDTLECVIIDPGCASEREFDILSNFIEENKLKPVKILLTHGHFDHMASAEDAASKWGIDIYMSDKDIAQVESGCKMGVAIGFEKPIKDFTNHSIDIKDGDNLSFGQSSLAVISTPGHTQGGVCYYGEKDKVLFSGDTLFSGSIGRTDLPGGDYEQLMESLMTKILKLPADVDVLPGHGPTTDIAKELSSNPFLQPLDFQQISL